MGVGKDVWTEIETRYNNTPSSPPYDLSGIASLFASDGVHIDPFGRREGREAIGAYLEEGDKPFSDIRMETSRMTEEGDTVVAEWTWWGTHTAPLVMPDGTEIPPTGKTVELPGVSVLTIMDGRFATDREYLDAAAMASQLGLMPST
jgi:steroid delta-isomerase-like uncharacterized protein